MKLSLKHIYICSLIGLGASTLASCNDFLDREPITNVTPEASFHYRRSSGCIRYQLLLLSAKLSPAVSLP